MSPKFDYPALAQLVARFVPYYEEVLGTAEEIVAMSGVHAMEGPRARADIFRLLQRPEQEVADVLAQLGNGYSYRDRGLTASAWLRELVAQIEIDLPAPDPQVAPLIGQLVRAVCGGDVLTLVLDEHEVDLRGEVGFASPQGWGRLAPDGDLEVLTAMVGEEVVAASPAAGVLDVATAHVLICTFPSPTSSPYAIHERVLS